MGTHPSNPSYDATTGRTLQDLIDDNEALLSRSVAEKYGRKLPFLFKVLSIEKVLSIQAHPDKKLAEQLHAADPKNYPDDNHKPEMALAITPFEGFCGFRPVEEIKWFLEMIPPFKELVDEATIDTFDAKFQSEPKEALRTLYGAVVTAKEDKVIEAVKGIVALAKEEPSHFAGGGHEDVADLIVRLDAQFPNDLGTVSGLFLNYLTMSPGEAVFLKANDPHAYISGDIIECMAASDNVVRGGFTPKFKDTKTLTSMLTYETAPMEQQKLKPVSWEKSEGDGEALLYDPPIEEFSVVKIAVPAGGLRTVKGIEGPSIAIITKGKATFSVGPKKEVLSEGQVAFVGATATTKIKADEDTDIFWAFAEL